MKKLINAFIKYRLICITSICFVLLMSFISILGMTNTGHVNSVITNMSQWVDTHKNFFAVWHIVLLLAIWFGWGAKVSYYAKQADVTELQVKKALRFRYWLIGFVALVSYLAGVY